MMEMSRIRTVQGDIVPSSLGRTLMHEHIFCDFYRVTGRLNELLNNEAMAVEELGAAAGRENGAHRSYHASHRAESRRDASD